MNKSVGKGENLKDRAIASESCSVCCGVLQCVTVVLQCVAVVAVCWRVLQYIATFCKVLQCVQCVAVCCSTLQCVAVCSALQCVAVVLQRVAVCCSV